MACAHVPITDPSNWVDEPFQTVIEGQPVKYVLSSKYPWEYTCKNCGEFILQATPYVAPVWVTEKELMDGATPSAIIAESGYQAEEEPES